MRKFEMWLPYITFIGVLCTLTPSTHSQALCQNPQGQTGACINIRRCPALLDLLQNHSQDPSIGNFLRSSLCGYEGTDPKVCCSTGTEHITDTGNDVDNDRDPNNNVNTLPYGPLYEPECGFGNITLHRILGGEPATLGAWPWITALGYTHPRNPGATRWLCGGALISRRHVLTAGHCVHGRGDLYKVRVGDLDLNADNDGAFPFEDYIDRRVVHPEYNPTTHTNDLAILRTTRDVPFTTKIHPICLPITDFYRTRNFENTFPFVAGWGSISFRGPTSSQLMQVQLPVRTEQDCRTAFQNFQQAVIDHRVLCAGFTQGGKDACQGDSGGPLMIPNPRNKKMFYLIGVVSYGYRCGEPGFPGVYTKVTAFLDFITSQMV